MLRPLVSCPTPRWRPLRCDVADESDRLDSGLRRQPRDPERIDQILAQIGEVWCQHPDMRLGQLLVNLLDPKPNALFNVEDDVLAARLREFVESGRWPTAR